MKKILFLLLALIVCATVSAEDFITDVMVIGGSKSETNTLKTTYTDQGWTLIDQDLNAGASGDYIFLLYKKASETANGASFITNFYISSASGTAPDEIQYDGRTYHLVPCDGSDYFRNSKGDLNSHCSGSAYIHLYYTKEYVGSGEDYSTVRSITINNTQAGAVGENGGTTGYDLNAGASGNYIYMHADKSQGWVVFNSVSENRCIITDFDGPKAAFTSVIIPVSINGNVLEGFSGLVFSGFTNLETMTFYENTIISQMPSMQGCSKFKHVKTDSINDQTPPSITNIPASAFLGTAIETINMPSVTNIGERAFEGCGLNQVTVHQCLMEISSYAFQNCDSLTDIFFDGTLLQWNNVTKGANWKPTATKEHWRCTVNFDANGHSTAPSAQTDLWSNLDKATEPTIYAFGYKILGWYTEATCTNQWNFNNEVPGDMTLYAKWEETQYGFNHETGELVLLWGTFYAGNKWGNDLNTLAVRSITANDGVSFTGNCSQLFKSFSNCSSIDLHNVNTSQVTNMSNMFYGCKNLTSLNLSGWNTSKVTQMDYMFFDCENLTSLDLSGWNTSKVTTMYAMFSTCINLSSLNITSFNTSQVTSMGFMFDACINLTSLDLSKWNTRKVTTMLDMFSYCTRLKSIYVGSGWDTSKVTSSGNMFCRCTALVGGMGTAYDENHINKEYARIDKGAREPGYLTGVFILNLPEGVTATPSPTLTQGNVNYYAAGTIITLSHNDYGTLYHFVVNGEPIESDIFTMPYTNVDVALLPRYNFNSESGELKLNWGEFNSYNKWEGDVDPLAVKMVTANNGVSFTSNCSELFYGFSNCKSIDLNNVKTIDMTYCRNMFYGCTSLESLNLTNWNIVKVTDMYRMFYNCSSLTSLDLYGWNSVNVTNMEEMFSGCSHLTSIYVGSRWRTANVINSSNMFSGCTAMVGGMGTAYDENHINKEYARIDKGAREPGYLSMIPRYTYNSETGELKLNWGEFNKDNKWGNEVDGDNVKSVTATSDVSFTGDCSKLFFGFGSCIRMDLSKVNTSDATDMNHMFFVCPSLTSLDISGWDISEVTRVDYMFYDCWVLPSLDLSGWNTKNVTYMDAMFTNCFELKTIYVGPMWNTENVSSSSIMFYNCTSLVGGMGTTFDASHTDKEYARIDGGPERPGYLTDANVSARYAFNSETGTLQLLWGEFNKNDKWGNDVPVKSVKRVTANDGVSFTGDCGWLFSSFSNCESMDLHKVNTSNVTDMSFMFSSCTSLALLNLSGWDTSNVTNMNNMFNHCSSLAFFDLSGWDTSNVTNMSHMFSECIGLSTLDLSVLNTGNVTDMSFMFSRCTGLSTLDLSNLNTRNVTNMSYIFYGCSNLGLLILSGWDTSNVTNMSGMFNSCSKLASLDISHLSTGNVTDMNHIFSHCTGLSSLDFSGWDTSNVTNMSHMFYGCTGLSTLDLSALSTGNVTDMNRMFSECIGLSTLDLSVLNTGNVTNMSFMFANCSNLASLDISHLSTGNVTNMSCMFLDCTRLSSLDLSGLNTDNVTNMSYMFGNCRSLPTLYLSGLSTGNVTNMNYMFTGCNNLTTIYADARWTTEKVTNSTNMFNVCTALVGGMGTAYNWSHTDKEYARIDGGPERPGYFTAYNYVVPGDVNGDGIINVNDITVLVAKTLGGNPQPFIIEAADLDHDGVIGITDITALIRLALSD